jgi:RNA polymerase sigma factor (sigma-70 family)
MVAGQARFFRGNGVALADLIQEGCIALIRAVDQFEAARHPDFAHYAKWRIRGRLCEIIRSTTEAAEGGAGDLEPLLDLVEDTETPDPYASALRAEVEGRVRELLHTLAEEEERVLRLRFGFDRPDPQTPTEVGRSLGVHPKHVRRIEGQALSMLKRRARRLRDFIPE